MCLLSLLQHRKTIAVYNANITPTTDRNTFITATFKIVTIVNIKFITDKEISFQQRKPTYLLYTKMKDVTIKELPKNIKYTISPPCI